VGCVECPCFESKGAFHGEYAPSALTRRAA
jgi:hypothetical protein